VSPRIIYDARMSIRLAVFDCDGTLVDSQANICVACERAFDDSGLAPPPRAAIRRIVGLSLVEAMRVLLPDADEPTHRMLAERYKESFRAMRTSGTLIDEPLFDGIADVLRTLVEDGWLLGVATGKSDRGLGFCLAHHGIADCFVTLQTADRHPSKPDPSMVLQAMAEAGASPETTVVIGDTSFDIAMAKAAGAAAIGVAWGYHDRADLLAEGADLVAEHPSELPTLLERLA
jgi:phosphoglycolate phosphatase